jgi:hypothetical protein
MQLYEERENMKNTLLVGVIGILCIVGGYFFIKDWNATTEKLQDSSVLASEQVAKAPVVPADSIEVVHFHGTQQCASCIAVGKYALQTIESKFSEEYASGKIRFKEINIDLKENQDIVTKYQAGGSSLFVNAIRGTTDDIVQDVTVWQLVNNEERYINYFEAKLKILLGK